MEEGLHFYKPTAFWSWNGRITAEEVRDQVRGFASAGLGGFFVHARGGLKCEYMKEEWFRCFDAAVEEAERCGLDVWIYDENGWPSGFAGGMVNGKGAEYQMKRLRPGRRKGAASVIRSGKHVLSVMNESGYVDLLNAKVTEAFLQETHEKYAARYGKYFGNVIRGVFTDEPQLDNAGGPYSEILPAEFEKRRGYALVPHLYKLFADAKGAEKFRRDYFDTVQELFVENFTSKINRWCERHGLLFTGHFPCEDGLCYQPSVTGGVMRHYAEMSMPGIDHLGRRYNSPILVKQLGSVRDLFGKPYVLSESFGGAGYGVSFGELLHIWAYQASMGINFCCLHLSAFTLEGGAKRDYPPAFSYQQPCFAAMPALSEEIGRINRFVSKGKSVADVLLVSALGGAKICRLESAEQRMVSSQFRLTAESLLAAQIPFEIADESFLSDASAADGKIRMGTSAFSVLILPYMRSVESNTLRLAAAFAAGGGTVFFIGEPPVLLDGQKSGEPGRIYARFQPVANRAGYLRKAFEYIGYARKLRLMETNEGTTAEDLTVSLRAEGNKLFALVVNTDLTSERSLAAEWEGNGSVSVRMGGAAACRRIPCRRSKGKTYAEITLPRRGYAELVFEPSVTAQPEESRWAEEERLISVGVVRESENALVLDRIFCTSDGFSAEDTADRLRKKIFANGKSCVLHYRFYADFVPENLQICAEIGKDDELRLNDVALQKTGWAFDCHIPKFDASEAVRKGENIATVRLNLARSGGIEEESFETLKNIFSFPKAVENLILLGDFTVTDGGRQYRNAGARWYSAEGPFCLKEAAVPDGNDFTQGAPFYAGNIRVRYRFEVREGVKRAEICLRGLHASAAAVSVNGEAAGTIAAAPYVCDVSKYIKRGENIAEILYYGNLRNLFGPFHHYKGDPAIAAPECFSGERGFADSYTNPGENQDTFVPEYNFLRFGVDCVSVRFGF